MVGKRVNRSQNERSEKFQVSQAIIRPDDSRELFWGRLVFALVLLWTFLGLCFPLLDTDFWWHLKTGEWIFNHWQIPGYDLYTFTDSDKRWIDLHWGFQVLITALYHVGGLPLVTLVKAATITAAVAIAWLAGGDQLQPWKKAAIWLLPTICVIGRGNERPEMLTQLFLAMWLWIAVQTDRRTVWIWWLPLLQTVWVNCHALFVLGLVVGFSYAVDAMAREIAKGRFGLTHRTSGPELPTIWIAGALVAIACFINPYLEEGALFPLTLYRKFSVEKEFYCNNIGEFRPPINFVLSNGIGNVYLLAEIGTWLIAATSFVWLFAQKRRWSIFRLLMFVGYSHLAWQASRNTNIFALISGFIACENFADSRRELSTSSAPIQNVAVVNRSKIMAAIMFGLCIFVVTGWWNEYGEKNKPFGLGEAPHWFIHDAAKFAGQTGFPTQAFVANNGQAEVYIYHNAPRCTVFMDARLEVCTQQTFELFNNVLRAMAMGNPGWQELFKDTELPVVILDSRTFISRAAINGMLATPAWRLVFADQSAAVFLPVEKANQLQLPLADPEPLMYPDGPPKRKN